MKLIDAGMRSGSVHPASPDTQSRTFTWAALKRPVRPGKSVGVAGSGGEREGAAGREGDGEQEHGQPAATDPAGGAGAGAPDG